MDRVSWRLACQVGRVAVPLLLLFLAAPSRAGATCGDYLTVHHPTKPTHEAPNNPGMPSPAKPCDGPNCSRGGSLPLLPVPVTSVSGAEQWASLIPFVRPSVPDASMTLSLNSPPPPMRLPNSVFRPPRA
jgi:hypothetical protein